MLSAMTLGSLLIPMVVRGIVAEQAPPEEEVTFTVLVKVNVIAVVRLVEGGILDAGRDDGDVKGTLAGVAVDGENGGGTTLLEEEPHVMQELLPPDIELAFELEVVRVVAGVVEGAVPELEVAGIVLGVELDGGMVLLVETVFELELELVITVELVVGTELVVVELKVVAWVIVVAVDEVIGGVVEASFPDLNSNGHSRALPGRGKPSMLVFEQSPVAGQASGLGLGTVSQSRRDVRLTFIVTASIPGLDVEAIVATFAELRTTVTATASIVWSALLRIPSANILELDIGLNHNAQGGAEEKKDLRAHCSCVSRICRALAVEYVSVYFCRLLKVIGTNVSDRPGSMDWEIKKGELGTIFHVFRHGRH
jgi:hypothetical protein